MPAAKGSAHNLLGPRFRYLKVMHQPLSIVNETLVTYVSKNPTNILHCLHVARVLLELDYISITENVFSEL